MTYYAQVINNEIVKINIQLPYSTPQASIGSVTFPGEHDLYPITGSEPSYDPATQRMSGSTYQFTGEAVERVYTVENIPQAELDAKFNSAIKDQIAAIEAKQARAVREAALGDTTHLVAIEAQIDALRAQLK